MQEQVPSNITPDQGWSQMKVLLDREMPVQRKSRRMLIWWRSATVLGLLLSFGFLMWTSANRIPAQQEIQSPAKEQPAAPSPADQEKTSDEAKQPVYAATSDIHAKENALASTSLSVDNSKAALISNDKPANREYPSRQTKDVEPSQTAVSGNSSEPVANHSAPTADIDIAPLHPDLTTDQHSAGVTENNQETIVATADDVMSRDDQTASITSTIAQRNGQVTVAIPSLETGELSIRERDAIVMDILAATPVDIKPVKRTQRLLNGYVAADAMAGYNHGGAWKAGAGLTVRALDKVHVNAGASYRVFKPDFSLSHAEDGSPLGGGGESIVNQDELFPSVGDYIYDYQLNPGTSYLALEPIVKTIHQWQVDASLTYDIGKHWFLQAGASFALKTTAWSSYPIIEDGDFATPYTPVRVSHELEDFDVIREHMVTLHGGIGYHIGRHLDLYVQADHSLNSYLLSDTTFTNNASADVDRSDYIRGLTLGIRYKVL